VNISGSIAGPARLGVDPPPSPFGRLVAQLRKGANLSQQELADRAELSRGYIAQLESGYRGGRVKRATVHRLAQALGAPVSELLRAANLGLTADDIPAAARLDFVAFVASEPTLTPAQRRLILLVYQEMQAQTAAGAPT
jgi:transcriptional regulator with XRE-family HTH domain